MEKEIGRAFATGASGREYTVVLIQEYKFAPTLNDPNGFIEGMKRIELDDGSPVTLVDNVLTVVNTGETLELSDEPED